MQYSHTHCQVAQADPQTKTRQRVCLSNRTKDSETHDRQEGQQLTRVWQKWRFSAPQTHLWLIKVWFSASTFVVKIATFAKPETVVGNFTAENFKNHITTNL